MTMSCPTQLTRSGDEWGEAATFMNLLVATTGAAATAKCSAGAPRTGIARATASATAVATPCQPALTRGRRAHPPPADYSAFLELMKDEARDAAERAERDAEDSKEGGDDGDEEGKRESKK